MEKDRFIDNGNGTVTDNQMKVMWKKTDSFQDTKKWLNWFKGHDYVEITNMERFAGCEDWRYPTQEEAWSLFDLNYRNTDKYGDEIYLSSIFERVAREPPGPLKNRTHQPWSSNMRME